MNKGSGLGRDSHKSHGVDVGTGSFLHRQCGARSAVNGSHSYNCKYSLELEFVSCFVCFKSVC